MTASEKPPVHRIYLLTVWQEPGPSEAGQARWRFHLTDPHTGKRYGFTDPAALLAALQQVMSEPPPAEAAP
jgi:hypothetical protein